MPQLVKGPGHTVGANYEHADVHFPTFKAWLYLSDVRVENGAFAYSPGSHRLTLARLGYEYEASIRIAEARSRPGMTENPYARTRAPTPEQRARMGIRCQPMEGRANTLVIGNMQGFHRQGDFAPGTVREALMLCFRNAEPGCPLTEAEVELRRQM